LAMKRVTAFAERQKRGPSMKHSIIAESHFVAVT